jgi:hypothetical protein
MLAHDMALALDPCLLMQEAGLEPDEWQESFLRSSSDRQLLLCTRQAGKSTVTAIMALHEARPFCYARKVGFAIACPPALQTGGQRAAGVPSAGPARLMPAPNL